MFPPQTVNTATFKASCSKINGAIFSKQGTMFLTRLLTNGAMFGEKEITFC